jgi:hypothetical protein
VSVERRRAIAAGLVVLAAAVVTAIVLATRDDRSTADAPPVVARVVVTPRTILFGDTIQARVEVALDRNRANADSLRIATAFEPWTEVRPSVRTRRDGGRTTFVQQVYTLRCVAAECVPDGPRPAELEFSRARIAYDDPGGAGHAFLVRWPVVVTSTRLVGSDFGRDDEYGTPWRADLRTLPAASYRLSPALLAALLLAGALALAVAGAALVYAALPKPRVVVEPEPEPEPPPPDLTPLERALALLEAPNPVDGAAGRRRALELVAEELAPRDPSLATSVRTLAWAAGKPAAAQARTLAERVRAMLEAERAKLDPVAVESNGAPSA